MLRGNRVQGNNGGHTCICLQCVPRQGPHLLQVAAVGECEGTCRAVAFKPSICTTWKWALVAWHSLHLCRLQLLQMADPVAAARIIDTLGIAGLLPVSCSTCGAHLCFRPAL